MKKSDTLSQWRSLPDNLPVLPHFMPIPYKTTGSRYGCCGIRIDGNPEFIDAVLSRLKDLIDGENHVTRLELARSEVQQRPGFNAGQNAGRGAQVCYIRLHVRGSEGAAASAFFDRHLHEPTNRFAAALGIDMDPRPNAADPIPAGFRAGFAGDR